MWKTDQKPEGDALLTTRDHLIKIGYWDGKYWWYDGRYHPAEEVIMWIELSEVLEVTRWPECLGSCGLMK